jgi:hypothetical protein
VLDHDTGGPTSVDNAALVCRYHHREHPKLGWQAQLVHGRVGWIPPPYLDPQQEPRFNQMHTAA